MKPSVVDTPCRLFQGTSRTNGGYGRIHGRLLHRWVWEQVNGPIPPKMVVLHKCDTPLCFRYDHLKLGTQLENVQDMLAKGRSTYLQGIEHPQAKLTAEMTYDIIRRHRAGESQRALGREYGINHSAISRLIAGKSYRNLEAHEERCR